MKITKAECLEFLQTNRINGKKNEHVYGLFVLVEKLEGKWPDPSDEIPINNWLESYKFGADPQRYMEINGYTPREFGRMVWAKNEIKRRENVRKAAAESKPKHINCHCVTKPLMSQEQFQSKVISEKMKGVIDSRLHDALFANAASKATGIERYEEEHSITFDYLPKGWRDLIKKQEDSAFNKLKTEQEEKKMRDSNAELKEGDKAILNNDQGFILHYGAELIGHEVEIVKFFSRNDIELAAVEYKGSIYCFRKSMLKPVKTERQKAIEFYLVQISMGMVQSVYKANEKYYGFAVESLIDSGYLNTKTPPVAR